MPKWFRHPEVLWRRCGDHILILPLGGSDVLVLDGTGRHAWELLDEPVDTSDLAGWLAEDYATDVSRVERELEPFLEELEAAGAAARIR